MPCKAFARGRIDRLVKSVSAGSVSIKHLAKNQLFFLMLLLMLLSLRLFLYLFLLLLLLLVSETCPRLRLWETLRAKNPRLLREISLFDRENRRRANRRRRTNLK